MPFYLVALVFSSILMGVQCSSHSFLGAHHRASFATTVVTGEGSPSSPVLAPQSQCSSYLYPSTCMMNGCSFCCQQPVGYQCMPHAMAMNTSICASPQFVLSNTPQPHKNNTPAVKTCPEICSKRLSTCDQCNAANWCLWCNPPTASSNSNDGAHRASCVGARQHCHDDSFQSTCADDKNKKDALPSYIDILFYLLAAVATLVVIIVLAVCCRRYRQNFVTPARWGNRENRNTPAGENNATATAHGGEEAPLLANEAQSPANEANSINANPNPSTGGEGGASVTFGEEEASPTTAAEGEEGSPAEGEEEEEEPAPMMVAEAEEGQEKLCQICMDGKPTVVFLPCYHSYCCSECSEQIRPNRRRAVNCPWCRTRIRAMLDVRSLHKPSSAGTESKRNGEDKKKE